MKYILEHSIILLVFCLLLAPFNASGQDKVALPAMAKAKEIDKGVLTNGISYFIVTNSAARGYADYALMARGETDPDAARHNLLSLTHFPKGKAYQFLTRKGTGFGSDGFIYRKDDATIYHFSNLPTSDAAASDTTMLMIFDLIARNPYEQTIIVSGDVNAAEMKEKMRVFAMMLSAPKQKFKPSGASGEDPGDSGNHLRINTRSASSITVSCSVPRPGRSLLGTTQPLVSRQMARELGFIVDRRVTEQFRQKNIPLADVKCDYLDCDSTPGDEVFSVAVITPQDFLTESTMLLSQILADISQNGVSAPELQNAKEQVIRDAEARKGKASMTNAEYVRKCVYSILYGTSLANAEAVNDFFLNSRLPVDAELPIFNRYAAAVLTPSDRMSLSFSSPSGGALTRSLEAEFDQAWLNRSLKADTAESSINSADTLSLFTSSVKKPKLKIEAEDPEPMSGGAMWTFSNGMKVIYKKTATPGRFDYALMLKGGLASVPGIKPGEASFVSDMLRLDDVAGMNCHDFRDMLTANGISMEERVTITDLRITGSAPRERLTLLLRTICSLAGSREPNPEAFKYWRQCELLKEDWNRAGMFGFDDYADSLLRGSYNYIPYRCADSLPDDFQQKVEDYVASLTAKMDDGLLVIMGDVEPETLKRTLCRYLEQMSVGTRKSVRPAVNYSMSVGTSTHTNVLPDGFDLMDGEKAMIYMSALTDASRNRWMALNVARIALEKELSKEFSEVGIWAETSCGIELYPQDKLSLSVTVRPSTEEGLPAGVHTGDPLDAVALVRNCLSRLSAKEVAKAEIDSYKTLLTKELEFRYADQTHVISEVLRRYSLGKDYYSNYAALVGGVTPAAVRDVFLALSSAGRVEYTIQ